MFARIFVKVKKTMIFGNFFIIGNGFRSLAGLFSTHDSLKTSLQRTLSCWWTLRLKELMANCEMAVSNFHIRSIICVFMTTCIYATFNYLQLYKNHSWLSFIIVDQNNALFDSTEPDHSMLLSNHSWLDLIIYWTALFII